ncbi:NfeD family protein [Paenibacillus alkalitolerans]|uniref:NfeD family protein n=1 Tax=Paenibacillus alkalitolerans TaxID=2799335 RepID=UPI0018F7BD52|nr:nodulation protein NfeD [Paenibacillus alkalitolerans]
MKSIRFGLCAVLILGSLLSWLAGAAAGAEDGQDAPDAANGVAVIPVNQTIETGLQKFMERAFAEAEARGVRTVVLEIDTFGGRVDAASDIGALIRNSTMETVAYVNGEAISAGSYIALNADRIYMRQGSTIGAAAVVTVSGERVTDSKIVSMWVGAMSGAAEATGRNPDIAVGMVDETVKVEMPEIPRTKEPGQLITLTAEEAVKVGYASAVVDSLEQVMKELGVSDYDTIEPTLAERLARVLTHPATTTILFILGLAGLLIELLVPGFGVPGIVGICSFALYFLGNYVAGFAGVEHLALFIAGVLLLVLELFIPSFGILGILGIISLISGVVMAAYDTGNALVSLGIAVLAAGVIVAVFVRYFKHKGVWNRFILKEELRTEEGYVSHKAKNELIGRTGTAVTPLRPSGVVQIDGERIDVVTYGDWIAANAKVEVVEIEGVRVVVREVSPSPGENR